MTVTLSRGFAATIAALLLTVDAAAGTFFYAFEDATKKGGIARLAIDPATGALSGHEIAWSDLLGAAPLRLALNDGQDRLLLVRDTKDGTNLLIFDVTQKKLAPIALEFGSRPDSVAVRGDLVIVTGTRGRIAAVDLRAGRVTATFDGRKALTPPGAKADLVTITSDGTKAFVTFQADSDDGKEKGHRIVALSLPSLALLGDVPLPRDQSALHPAGSAKDAGPGPEVLVLSPKNNAALVTLDIYGAVGIADLDGLATGKWSNAKVLPTALDSTMGVGFPDRAIALDVGGKDYAFTFNAGSNGGLTVVDFGSREIVHRVGCQYGLDQPIYLEAMNAIVAGNCGKVKSRTATGVSKDKVATEQIVVVDVSPLKNGEAPKVSNRTASGQLHRVHAVDAAKSSLLALLLKTKDGSKIASFDLAKDQELGAVDAFGKARASAWSTRVEPAN